MTLAESLQYHTAEAARLDGDALYWRAVLKYTTPLNRGVVRTLAEDAEAHARGHRAAVRVLERWPVDTRAAVAS